MQEERNVGGCREAANTETLLYEITQLVQQYGPEFAALHREEQKLGWQPIGAMSIQEAEQVSERLDVIQRRTKEITGEVTRRIHRLMLAIYEDRT